MGQSDCPLIVGAGPVGLGAALFLTRQGRIPRIVEKRDQPSQQSRALAVNPRTLDILEPTGVSQRMLELGLPIHGASFYRRERLITNLSFANIHSRYPFMLALSQATTERLLEQALEAQGGRVERGVQMVACDNSVNPVEATLLLSDGLTREQVCCPWLFAADGAHSVARQQTGIEFTGTSFAREWHLTDAPLHTTLAPDRAHVFFLERGVFLFMIRVVDEGLQAQTKVPLWRVITNRPAPLSRLVRAEQAGMPVWNSSFHIAHRINATFAQNGVYFAGDAAHVHSPVGARGMNLGLEDAWVFTELLRVNQLSKYDQLRRPVDGRVVQRVKLLSRMASAESEFFWFMRTFVFPAIIRIPFLRTRMVATVTGLDHELPELNASRSE